MSLPSASVLRFPRLPKGFPDIPGRCAGAGMFSQVGMTPIT